MAESTEVDRKLGMSLEDLVGETKKTGDKASERGNKRNKDRSRSRHKSHRHRKHHGATDDAKSGDKPKVVNPPAGAAPLPGPPGGPPPGAPPPGSAPPPFHPGHAPVWGFAPPHGVPGMPPHLHGRPVYPYPMPLHGHPPLGMYPHFVHHMPPPGHPMRPGFAPYPVPHGARPPPGAGPPPAGHAPHPGHAPHLPPAAPLPGAPPAAPHPGAQAPAAAVPVVEGQHGKGFQVRLNNVPPELGAQDLAEAFLAVSTGRVETVDVLRDARGAPTGEAIVIFSNAPDAQNAVRRYHGGDLNGRRLQVVFEGEVVKAAR